jgi:hypothetical protein
MLYLSEILLQNYDMNTFDELVAKVQEKARTSGEIHFHMDVKPTYPDTPEDWEDRLEGAFVGINSVMR